MLFRDVLGLGSIKRHLMTTADSGRVAHAQLFIGSQGSGVLPMALAYAQYLLCGSAEDNNRPCYTKCRSLTHPDLHFAFPVATSDKVKSRAVSDHYLEAWRQFIKEQPYGNLFDWYKHIGIEKKQGQIGVNEAQDIVKKLTLKSYEGGYKVLLIWRAEKMNNAAANKLLKLIEEPPSKTVLLLLAEDETQIINTIRSRCQQLHFPPLAKSDIVSALVEKGINEAEAEALAQQANGDFNRALALLRQNPEALVFENWFVNWVRSAFKAKGNKSAVLDLTVWSREVAQAGREVQKQFLYYCLEMIRQALLLNYKIPELVYTQTRVAGFDLSKFAPFVHENNILGMVEALEQAIFHVERNGNPKLIFTDLSLTLTRLLHVRSTLERA